MGRKSLPENEPVVYFISPDPDTGPTKIGVSRKLPRRLAALQTAHHQDLQVVAWVECGDEDSAYALEAELHDVCANRRIRNEWFDINAPEIKRIAQVINISSSLSYVGKRGRARVSVHPLTRIPPKQQPRSRVEPPPKAVFEPVTNMTGRDFLAMLSERED